MTGIDTNVLVRFLVLDDRVQAERARQFFDHLTESGDHGFVTTVVLCEVVWVLSSAYRLPAADVAHAIEQLLHMAVIEVERKDVVLRALDEHRHGRGDFADCLIGLAGIDAGCDATVTFDRGLRSNAAFRQL